MSKLSVSTVDRWCNHLPSLMIRYLRLACIYMRLDIRLDYRQYIVALKGRTHYSPSGLGQFSRDLPRPPCKIHAKKSELRGDTQSTNRRDKLRTEAR